MTPVSYVMHITHFEPLRWRGVQRLSPSLPDIQSSLPGGLQPEQRSQSGGRPEALALQHQGECAPVL